MDRATRRLDDVDDRPGSLPFVEALFEMRWALQLVALVALVAGLRAFGPLAARQGIDELIGLSTSRTSAVVKTLWTRAGNVWGSVNGDR